MTKRTSKKKVLSIIALLLTSLFLIEIISAADVAYVYKSQLKIDDNILQVFSEMNLSVSLINEKNLPKNFSDYRFLFVGDERYSKNIPVNDYPSVITNYYYGEKWGLTDKDGISKLGGNSPLSVNKDGEIIQVYTKAMHDLSGVSIPYYYLGTSNKAPGMQQIAGTYSGNNHDLGDVISYAKLGALLKNKKYTKGNLCFFGIVSSDYWTDEARKMFKDCIGFVALKCSNDEQCPSDEKSEFYCKDNNVYQNLTDFYCKNPGTSSSECDSNVISELIETCSYGCEDGECLPECTSDAQCDDKDYYSDNYCSNNSVYRDFHDFSCENEECEEEIIKEVVEECGYGCENGECKENIICSNNSQCNDNDIYTYDECNNPGTVDSYCTNTPVNCITNNDCGITGFIGNEFCSLDDVYKNFQNSTCINPGMKTSHCDVLIEQTLVKDCGDSSCNDYGQNYCKDNDVYHSRTCYEKGCLEGACFSVNNEEESLVEECEYGCENGICIGECTTDKDCGDESYSNNYCSDGKVIRDHLMPKCINSMCSVQNTTETVEVCSNGCENGKCLAKKIHDVGFIDFTGSVNKIFLEYSNGTDILDENPVLNCKQIIKAKIRVKNLGDYLENVSLNGNIGGISFSLNKIDNLQPNNYSDRSSLSPYITLNLSSGTYYITVNAVIPSDANPSDNKAIRQIKVICSVCVDNDNDGYDTCNPGDDGDDGNPIDCNDNDANVHPDTPEICNGIDDNCDGIIDEGCECINGDTKKCGSSDIGECEYGIQTCSNGEWGECIGDIEPSKEICDLKDNDCDGVVDENNGDCEQGEMCVDGECKKIKCSSNSECGEDGYIGDLFCEDNGIYQNYQTFKCNNPGTFESYCTDSITAELIEECYKNQVCSNAKCQDIECKDDDDCDDYNYFTIDKCHNPGTIDSYCTNEPMNCKKNSDCGRNGWTGDLFCSSNNVFQNFIAYKCNNPGTSESYCSHNTNSKLVEECESEQVCANGECKGIICHEDFDCDDNNLYTHDECNNPGTANSYCSHDFVNCVTNNDCGPTGFIRWEICAQDDVVKYFQNSTCNNPGTMQSYCEISITEKLIKDCGEDYCTNYGQNYCKNNDVYHSRTCYEQGCYEGACFSGNPYTNEDLVKECEYGCKNGMCTGECEDDEDCGEESYSENYCDNDNVVREHTIPVCINNECDVEEEIETIEVCSSGCEDGECVSGMHDIVLVDFTNSVNKIKLETIDGVNILEPIPTLRCGDTIKAKVKVLNKGEFSENVVVKGNVDGINFSFTNIDSLMPGSSIYRSSLFPYIKLNLASGLYDLIVNAQIPFDSSPSDNTAIRQIRIICENNCDEAKNILNNIYSVVNSANPSNIFLDRYSLNQERTTVYCNAEDELLSGAGTAPLCDDWVNPMCNKITYFEQNHLILDGNKKGWVSAFDAGSVDKYYDTIITEAICLRKNTNFSKYFSIYTKTIGGSDIYSLNQNNIVVYCDDGDKVIAGGGSAPSCNGVDPACGKNQIIVYNGAVSSGSKEGWKTIYSVDGGNDDTVQTTAICLKKTAIFDDYLKVYTITNEGPNSKNQDKRISMCNAGDIAIAGGGNICTSPECNYINYFEGNYKIDGNPQGWYTAFDLKSEDPTFDTQRSSVTCIGLKKTNEGGMC